MKSVIFAGTNPKFVCTPLSIPFPKNPPDPIAILDCVTFHPFPLGSIEGSTNIPLGQVPNRIDEFKAMKKPLVLCCLSGGRSGQAVDFLAANGVEEIYNGGGWNMVAMRKG